MTIIRKERKKNRLYPRPLTWSVLCVFAVVCYPGAGPWSRRHLSALLSLARVVIPFYRGGRRTGPHASRANYRRTAREDQERRGWSIVSVPATVTTATIDATRGCPYGANGENRKLFMLSESIFSGLFSEKCHQKVLRSFWEKSKKLKNIIKNRDSSSGKK